MTATAIVILNIVLDVAIVATLVALHAHGIVEDRRLARRWTALAQRRRARAYRPRPARGSSRLPAGA